MNLAVMIIVYIVTWTTSVGVISMYTDSEALIMFPSIFMAFFMVIIVGLIIEDKN